MDVKNKNFYVPYYIFEEIVQYVEQTADGSCKSMKWENIKSLLNLSVINKKLTKEQAELIKSKFCREKH